MEVRTRAIFTLCGDIPRPLCAPPFSFSPGISLRKDARQGGGRLEADRPRTTLVNLLGERLRPAEALAGAAERQACSCQPLPGLGQGGARPPMQGERHAL